MDDGTDAYNADDGQEELEAREQATDAPQPIDSMAESEYVNMPLCNHLLC